MRCNDSIPSPSAPGLRSCCLEAGHADYWIGRGVTRRPHAPTPHYWVGTVLHAGVARLTLHRWDNDGRTVSLETP